MRIVYRGSLIYSGMYTKARAEEALAKGWADLIGFGRPFIANPDLPYRLEHDLALADGDRSTLRWRRRRLPEPAAGDRLKPPTGPRARGRLAKHAATTSPLVD